MSHSTGTPTRSQKTRLEKISAMRCVACEIERISQPWGTEVHHLVDKGTRKLSGGHDATIPLCLWHHRGICQDGSLASDMVFLYGPSLALNKKSFVLHYGTERDLLARVDQALESQKGLEVRYGRLAYE